MKRQARFINLRIASVARCPSRTHRRHDEWTTQRISPKKTLSQMTEAHGTVQEEVERKQNIYDVQYWERERSQARQRRECRSKKIKMCRNLRVLPFMNLYQISTNNNVRSFTVVGLHPNSRKQGFKVMIPVVGRVHDFFRFLGERWKMSLESESLALQATNYFSPSLLVNPLFILRPIFLTTCP